MTLASEIRTDNTLPIRRYFTRPDPSAGSGLAVDPYDEAPWELRTALIAGADGKPENTKLPNEFRLTRLQHGKDPS